MALPSIDGPAAGSHKEYPPVGDRWTKATMDFRLDFLEYKKDADHPPTSLAGSILRLLALQRIQAVFLFRLAQNVSIPTAIALKWINQFVTGSDLSPRAIVGSGLQLFHPVGVVIGPRVSIGARCRIMQGVTLGHGRQGSPTLGDDVFLGAHAVIVGGVTVGDRVSIGANSIVTFDVPADALVRSSKSSVRTIESPQTALDKPPAHHDRDGASADGI